jgi:hypothetical protein
MKSLDSMLATTQGHRKPVTEMTGFLQKLGDDIRSVFGMNKRTRKLDSEKPFIPTTAINVIPLNDGKDTYSLNLPSLDNRLYEVTGILEAATQAVAENIFVRPRKHKVIYHASKERSTVWHRNLVVWDEVI